MNLLHYGLQRSGTNFLESLVKKNFQVKFLNSIEDRGSPLVKHFRLYDEKDIVPSAEYRNSIMVESLKSFERLLETVPDFYFIISKDPYSWFISYNNWAKKCNWPNAGHHYVVEYNLFYKKWLDFARETDRIIFIRYIDLMEDTERELDRLSQMAGLKRRFIGRFFRDGVGKVAQSTRFTDDRRSYYRDKLYLEKYSEEELREINSQIDINVLSLLGYELEGETNGAVAINAR